MGKIERVVIYGLLCAFGIATVCMFVVVLDLRSTAQTAAAQAKASEQTQVSATTHIQWVVPGGYPNNLAGTPYSQFYWVEDPNARSLTLFGIKGNLVNGQFKIGQDKIGSLTY